MIRLRRYRVLLMLVVVLVIGTVMPASATVTLGSYARTLSLGARGDVVGDVQTVLHDLGYSIVIDGWYGPQTQAVVRAFQKDRGLMVDGVLGPVTWAALTNGATTPTAGQFAVAEDQTYIVKRGDTVAILARRFNTTVAHISELNRLQNPNLIHVGDRLEIPPVATDVSSAKDPVASPQADATVLAEQLTRSDAVQLPADGQVVGNLPERSDATEPTAPLQNRPIALTFDDGPDPVFTPKIMEALDAVGARATFFVVGAQVELYPTVIKALVQSGHQLENHSYSHRSMIGLKQDQVQLEISRTSDLVYQIAGVRTHYFRPPLGAFDSALTSALEETNHELVLWNNVGGADLSPSHPDEFIQATIGRTFPGAILMLHATEPGTAALLPDLLKALSDSGYYVVTLDELLDTVAAMAHK